MSRTVFALFVIVSTAVVVSAAPVSSGNGGVYGADVSSFITVDAWECLKSSHDVSFAVVRCYRSVGSVDGNCGGTVRHAWTAGLSHVDLYHFPDVHKSADTQVKELASFIKSEEIKYGTVWIDVEPYTDGWGSDHATNVKFLKDLRSAMEHYLSGHAIGIYCGEYGWNEITGGSTEFSDLSLWYAHWDESASFSDFKAFGGWTKPAAKQFRGGHTECGVDIDANWYP